MITAYFIGGSRDLSKQAIPGSRDTAPRVFTFAVIDRVLPLGPHETERKIEGRREIYRLVGAGQFHSDWCVYEHDPYAK